MKKFSLFLVSCFLLQSFAWAGPKEKLKSILDEYRYAVTVEWDQKDKAQLENFKSKFSAELVKLIQAEKLSVKDVTDFVKENSKEFKIDANAIELLKDQNGQLNLERAEQLLKDSSEQMYMQGSSWAPEQLLLYGLVTLAVFEIVVLIITARDDKCPNPTYHPNDVPYTCIYE
ncbi:MAG: hypothetical protein H0V66_10230 [Bdellovibrionales bacterium]|nr:hypothetical protein [Bdellovibrionales bacterium]